MKRTFSILLLSILLVSLLSLPVSASEALPLVIDRASLMTEDEVVSLEETARVLSNGFEMDIVILTVDSLDGKTPEAYADDYYDYTGYGFGEDYSGILFLLSMEERDWYISTYGDAIYALTDYGIQQTAEAALPYLSDGNYYGGFSIWLDEVRFYLDGYSNDAPIDGYADHSGDYYHGTREDTVYYEEDTQPSILLSLVIGLAAAAITVLIMRGSMNTKRPQSSAGSYLAEGSFHLRTHQDIFLYSNVRKTARPQNNGGGGGGGSSIHRSSSGRSHGGGGGKF